ncbi:UDP-glucuronic acid decarboxylase family protein [Brevundimonas diminuta]|uniref:UDP-glucuronic acid decarboxylase family protein n=1 Tax=Brevundimonas diminuta TaxID=293 RepID=UPI0032094FEE
MTDDRFSYATPRDAQTAKRIAVSGGAGFLGSHLCGRLIDAGHHVTCIDNFHTGRHANVAHLMSSDRFHLVAQDINEPLDEALGRFDQIYNLACPASPVHYQYDRVKTAMTCSIGTLNLLKRAAADGARFFQASTSEIYGDPEIHPQVESYRGNVNTVGPRSCYDEGKRFAETLVTDFGQQHGLTTRIVRIFNTYGPRMHPDDGRVVSNFIVQALAGRDITIYGTGEQTRSFCFVDDLIEGFIRLMETDEEIDGPVNIGNPNEITVNDLARRVIALSGSGSQLVYHPLPIDDPRRRKPDISRALAHLRWSPLVPLEEGLEQTIAYFAGELEGQRLAQSGASAS